LLVRHIDKMREYGITMDVHFREKAATDTYTSCTFAKKRSLTENVRDSMRMKSRSITCVLETTVKKGGS